MLPGRHPYRHLATRANAAKRQTWPCHRLSPCHSFPAPQADGAAQSGLSRPALPTPRLRPCVRRLARRARREIRLPRHGRPSGARTRTHLRGRARRCAASRSRRRHPAGPQGAHRTLPPEEHGTTDRRRHAALSGRLRPDRRDRGRSRMNATVKIDAARVELLLSELRLPGIKLIWTALAETADKEAGLQPASWLRWPNRRWWNAAGAASNVTWKKPDCHRERRKPPVRTVYG